MSSPLTVLFSPLAVESVNVRAPGGKRSENCTPTTGERLLEYIKLTGWGFAFFLLLSSLSTSVLNYLSYPTLAAELPTPPSRFFFLDIFRPPLKAAVPATVASIKQWLMPAVHSTLTLWHLALNSLLLPGAARRRSIVLTLAFTSAYMLYDLRRILVLGTFESELLYVLHHVTTLVYMLSVVSEGAGYELNAALIFLGEVSNPPMCIWGLYQAPPFGGGLGDGEPHQLVTNLFALMYVSARFVFGPPLLAYIVWRVTRGAEKSVKAVVRVMWVFAVVAVIGGSVDFGKQLYSSASFGFV